MLCFKVRLLPRVAHNLQVRPLRRYGALVAQFFRTRRNLRMRRCGAVGYSAACISGGKSVFG